MDFVLIGAGAVLGANLRYLVAVWAVQRFGASFPYGTFLINVTGSFLIGLLLVAIGDRVASALSYRLFFVTGFLGAYTTFSTFSYEALALVERQDWVAALLYAGGSVLLGVLGTALGAAVGRSLQ